ncbi:7-cyano-7-deazaguanine synthase [Paraburkholderia sp. WS6]|uniref:7-cyano-7-deazaguanine synthase n=1 Tax=Paraburkholderia TaxID=1822464 RepID=UPI003461B3B5
MADVICSDRLPVATTQHPSLERGSQLGVDFEKTWSCFLNGRYHRGVCGPCVSRKDAFASANISDPTTYTA